jgi:y4mF family transcriptional regulator
LHEDKARTILPIGKMNMNPIELGKIIRRTREGLNLRQDQLAGAAGVGVRLIGELEAGKPTIQIRKALAVLDALGCRVLIETPSPHDAPQ